MKRMERPHPLMCNWPTANYCRYEDGSALTPGKHTKRIVLIGAGMDFSMVPGDKPSDPEVLDALEAANPGLSIWVYEVLEIETQNESRKEFVCTRRSQVEVASADDELRLFHYQGHYSFITDINRLLSMRGEDMKSSAYGGKSCLKCPRCLQSFKKRVCFIDHVKEYRCKKLLREDTGEQILKQHFVLPVLSTSITRSM